MDSGSDYLQHLSRLADWKEKIRLLNTFRGLPIENEAVVIGYQDGYLAVRVHEYQAVCMALENTTLIQDQDWPEVIRANVMAVDIPKKQAVLGEFTGAGNEIGQRVELRVHPREPMNAEIYDGDKRIGGKIADLSCNGIGLFTFAAYIYENLLFEPNQPVYIDFRLPASNEISRFRGVVTSVVPDLHTQLYRLGLNIDIPQAQAEALNQYIHSRQTETLEELKSIYESMCYSLPGETE